MVDETLVKQARAIAAKHGYVSLVALAIGCTPAPSAQDVLMVTAEPSDATVVAPDASTVDASIVADEPPKGLSCLARTHAGTPKKAGDRWGLLLADGTFVPWEKRDGERTDVSPFGLKDNYETRYAVGPIVPVTREDQNPGRVRVDELFKNTYGKTAREVQTSLVTVMVGGKAFAVHTKIAAPLRRVAVHVADAMKKDPKLERFFASPGGTFNWRFIAGTTELSMHSWAIAIDLDVGWSNYWRNSPSPLKWTNRYPQALVDAFEAEGFIWGGRWYYFDTMHFEYRPELVDSSCYP